MVASHTCLKFLFFVIQETFSQRFRASSITAVRVRTSDIDLVDCMTQCAGVMGFAGFELLCQSLCFQTLFNSYTFDKKHSALLTCPSV